MKKHPLCGKFKFPIVSMKMCTYMIVKENIRQQGATRSIVCGLVDGGGGFISVDR
jgi:hypothetical protein